MSQEDIFLEEVGIFAVYRYRKFVIMQVHIQKSSVIKVLSFHMEFTCTCRSHYTFALKRQVSISPKTCITFHSSRMLRKRMMRPRNILVSRSTSTSFINRRAILEKRQYIVIGLHVNISSTFLTYYF